jgi:hypothetical protein
VIATPAVTGGVITVSPSPVLATLFVPAQSISWAAEFGQPAFGFGYLYRFGMGEM